LHKRHIALSWHRVRKSITAKILFGSSGSDNISIQG
jgi:hypothetical protein